MLKVENPTSEMG